MTEYKKPHFDGRYEVKNMKGEDVLLLLEESFSMSPMRAVLSEGKLGSRIDMLESVFNTSLERRKNLL